MRAPTSFGVLLCVGAALTTAGCNTSQDDSAADAALVASPSEACAKRTQCGASVCSIEGVPGAATLNELSCPQACCTATDACGLQLTATHDTLPVQQTECIALAQAGAATPECPSYLDSFAVGSENLASFERDNLRDVDFAGCCRPEAACGFNVSAYGLGCVSAQDMAKFAAVVPFVSALAPRACNPLNVEQ